MPSSRPLFFELFAADATKTLPTDDDDIVRAALDAYGATYDQKGGKISQAACRAPGGHLLDPPASRGAAERPALTSITGTTTSWSPASAWILMLLETRSTATLLTRIVLATAIPGDTPVSAGAKNG